VPPNSAHLLAALLFAGLAAFTYLRYRVARAQYAREFERLERQNEIGRVLLTDRNVRGVTRHVAESAARLLGSDLGHVTLATGDPTRLVVEAATGALSGMVGAAVPIEGSMAGWVIRRVQPLVLNDPEAPSATFRVLQEGVPLRRSVMLPLIARGRCVGALGVDNPRDGRPFGPRDVALLRDLADYAALTIEAIQAIEELAERERRAALLNRVNSRIRQSLDLGQILDTAVRELGEALKVSRCYVRLRRGGALVETAAAEWFGAAGAPDAAEPAGAAAIPERAFRERHTVEASDVREPGGAGGAGPAAPLAVLATPIIFRGEIIGVLAFHQAGLPRLWRTAEIALVEEIAAELGIALSNARLYRSVEDASRELAVKIAELERANRLKTQFLANMSHELRTPLNSVIGFSEILLAAGGASLTADQRDGLETIARNGRHLLHLVNDVLDLAKVDAGRMELRLAPVDVHRLVHDVLGEIEALVKAKGHRVHVQLGEQPLPIVADVTRARQVLFNLLSNAVKFTPPAGEITVQAELRAEPEHGTDPARNVVRLAVSDTGIGIAADDLPQLFTEFTQIDGSYARPYEGTGLGLALCRRLMTLHGGRIGAESVKGTGSTFWVEFPVSGPATVPPSEAPHR